MKKLISSIVSVNLLIAAVPVIAESKQSERIVGGTDATSAPSWMANLLGANGTSFCGGSLIAPNLILTAAHCVDEEEAANITIALGGLTSEATDASEKIQVKKIHSHESWGKDENLSHDIAILELENPSSAKPVILEVKELSAGDTVKAIGWGSLNSDTFLINKDKVEPFLKRMDSVGYGELKDQLPDLLYPALPFDLASLAADRYEVNSVSAIDSSTKFNDFFAITKNPHSGWLPVTSSQNFQSKLKETSLNVSDSSQCETDNNYVFKSTQYESQIADAKTVIGALDSARTKVINESLEDTFTGQAILGSYLYANELANNNAASLYAVESTMKVGNGVICAQPPAGASLTDVCQGDSGGPLFSEESGNATLVGLVSYGPGCALPGAHGVYTKVKAYADWISSKTVEINGTDTTKPDTTKPTEKPSSKKSSSKKGGSFGFGIFSAITLLILFRRKSA